MDPAVTYDSARRLGVWESEGGLLDVGSPMSVRRPLTWWPAARLIDVAPGHAVHADVHGHSICLVHSDDEVHALQDECSHGQVRLSEGDVVDGQIECWQHGSCFDLSTGEPTGPPATAAVPVFPVRIVNSTIEVELPPVDV